MSNSTSSVSSCDSDIGICISPLIYIFLLPVLGTIVSIMFYVIRNSTEKEMNKHKKNIELIKSEKYNIAQTNIKDIS
jgi:hypothetical protein